MCHDHIGPGQDGYQNDNLLCLACHDFYNRPGPQYPHFEGDRDDASSTSDESCVNSLVDSSSEDEPDMKTSVRFRDEVVLQTFPVGSGCTSGGALLEGRQSLCQRVDEVKLTKRARTRLRSRRRNLPKPTCTLSRPEQIGLAPEPAI